MTERREFEKKESTPRKGCLIIAEVAQAHDGSLGTAHAYIDAIAGTGADAVKFQCHAGSPFDERWRVKFSLQDDTRYDYRVRTGFSREQWLGLQKHAEDCDLEFIVSPFSMGAVDLLKEIGIVRWKVPSGHLTDHALLREVGWGKYGGLTSILLSTGMAYLHEIDAALEVLKHNDVIVMQCTTKYPTRPSEVGLNQFDLFRTRYLPIRVGLSDHSGTIYPSLIAAWEGAEAIEVHVKLSPYSYGPDASSSITIDELADLVRGVKFIKDMTPVVKNQMAVELKHEREVFLVNTDV